MAAGVGTGIGRAGAVVVSWVLASLPMRVWSRLSQARGSVLVNGIAYAAFFSIFPIVALFATTFSQVLQSYPRLRESLVSALRAYLDDSFPGVLELIDPNEVLDVVLPGGLLSLTGVASIAFLVWAALGWVSSLRLGIRAAMHLSVHDFHPAWAKVRDFLIALVIGAAVIVSAAASVSLGRWAHPLFSLVGVPNDDEQMLLRLLVFVVVALLDTGVFYLQYRLLAASPLPRRFLLRASVVAALLFGVLKQVATQLLPLVTLNSLLSASFFSLLGLLIWMNLVARLTLLCAAWAGLLSDEAEARAAAVAAPPQSQRPGTVAAATPVPRSSQSAPQPSPRPADGVTLAAGVVLGATAAVGVRAVSSAVAATLALVRARLGTRRE